MVEALYTGVCAGIRWFVGTATFVAAWVVCAWLMVTIGGNIMRREDDE